MLRGIEKREIFRDDEDRHRLLGILEQRISEEEVRCYAWAFMPNHVHLVVRAGPAPISKLMQRVGTAYALAFNRRHDRVGHLFQNRFKSVLIEEDEHLRAEIRYVVRNPLDGGIVDSDDQLLRFPWTSLPATLGTGVVTFESVIDLLSVFAENRHEARRLLLKWVLERPAEPAASIDDSEPPEPESPPAPPLDPELETLAETICERVGASPARLRAGRRDTATAHARALVAYHAIREMGVPQPRVAAVCGVSQSAVSQAAARGRVLAQDAAAPAGGVS